MFASPAPEEGTGYRAWVEVSQLHNFKSDPSAQHRVNYLSLPGFPILPPWISVLLRGLHRRGARQVYDGPDRYAHDAPLYRVTRLRAALVFRLVFILFSGFLVMVSRLHAWP